MKTLRLALFALSLCFANSLMAGIEEEVQSVKGNGIIDATMAIADQWVGKQHNSVVKNRKIIVKLSENPELVKYIAAGWSMQVNYTIDVKFPNGLSNTRSAALIINSSNLLANSRWSDVDVYEGVNSAELTVTGVTFQDNVYNPIANIPESISLELITQTERYYNFSSTGNPSIVSAVYSSGDNTLDLSWDYYQGAEMYDLEWVFVASGGTGHQTSGINYDFKNATRVQVSDNNYKISLAGPKGSYIYRVRGVTYDLSKNDYKNNFRYSQWSYSPTTLSIDQALANHSSNKCYYYSNGVDQDKNWTYTATYAENGKRKEVASFADGSGRTRQMVTIVNSDNNAIVAETKYDRVGRGAIQIVPTPVQSQGIKYYGSSSAQFNGDWDYDQFDTDDHLNESNSDGLPEPLPPGAKSREYYSSANSLNFVNKDAVPDGGSGYLYSMTQYTTDGTNRPKVVTSPGDEMRYKAQDGKNTRYIYTTPTQPELDRLFGSEIGTASHYEKVVVIDPNGQISVQYKDPVGRVIASALAGDNPDNLDQVPSYNVDLIEGTIFGGSTSAGNSSEVKQSMNVSFSMPTNAVVSYELLPVNISTCLQPSGVNVSYNYQFDITDDKGSPVKDASGTLSSTSKITLIEFEPGVNEYIISRNIEIDQSRKETFLSTEEARLEANKMNQSCYPYYEISGDTICEDFDCAGGCQEAYSFELNGEIVYLDDIGNEYVKNTSNRYYNPDSPGSTYTESDPNAPFNIAIANCTAECLDLEDPTTNTDLRDFYDDRCNSKWEALKFDMGPGGQYWESCSTVYCFQINDGYVQTYDSIVFSYNSGLDVTTLYNVTTDVNGEACFEGEFQGILMQALYADGTSPTIFNDGPETIEREKCETITGSPLTPEELFIANSTLGTSYSSWAELRANWTEETAEDLLFLHPEYCAFDFFCNYSESGCSPSGTLTMDEINGYLGKMFTPATYDDAIDYTEGGTTYNFMNPLGFGTNTSYGKLYFNDDPNAVAGVDPLITCHGSNTAYLSGYAKAKLTQYLQEFIPKTEQGNATPIGHFSLWYLLDDPQGISEAKGGNSPWANFDEDARKVFNLFHGDGDCQPGLIQSEDDKLFYFRNIYLFLREKVIYDYFDDVYVCPNTSNPYTYWDGDTDRDGIIDPGASYGAGMRLTFPKNPIHDLYDDPEDVDALADMAGRVGDVDGSIQPTELDDCTCGEWQSYLAANGLTTASDEDIKDFVNNEFCKEYSSTDIAKFNDCISGTNMVYINLLPADLKCSASSQMLEQVKEECEANKIRIATEIADVAWEVKKKRHLDSLSAAYDRVAIDGLFTNETVKLGYELGEYQYTLYYYDLAGNLIKTIPPKGVSVISNQTDLDDIDWRRRFPAKGKEMYPQHTMATSYQYNTQNQLKSQTTPDGGTTEFWYDKAKRLIASQNAKQLLGGDFSYTLYDGLGRVVESGQINNPSDGVMNEDIAIDPSLFDSWIKSGVREQVTVTFYDQSLFDLTNSSTHEDIHKAFGGDGQTYLRNRVASSAYFPTVGTGNVYSSNGAINLAALGNYFSGDPYTSAVHYSYDPHGNVETFIQEFTEPGLVNKDRRFVRTEYEYDLVSGNVNKVSFQPRGADAFYHKYEYDADNRLIAVETSSDGITWTKDAKYFYYPHGPLSRVELGNQKVQGMDYVYTLQGWLKAVNGPSLAEGDYRGKFDLGKDARLDGNLNQIFSQDVYGYQLDYYNGDYVPNDGYGQLGGGEDFVFRFMAGNPALLGTRGLYNGNIARMITSFYDNTEEPVTGAISKYNYDQLNRITSYQSYEDGSLGSSNAGVESSDFGYSATYSYDDNGNLLTLTREDDQGTVFDNFDYDYQVDATYATNTNRLNYVYDMGNIVSGIGDIPAFGQPGSQADQNYSYDAIGNLTSDASEDINAINWTLQGKIKSILKDNGDEEISFEYDPMGNRVRKTVDNSGGIKSTFYARDAQGNVLAIYSLSGSNLKREEVNIYGSDRLGMIDDPVVISNEIYEVSNQAVELLGDGLQVTPGSGNGGPVTVGVYETPEYVVDLKSLFGDITLNGSGLTIIDGVYSTNGDLITVGDGGNITVKATGSFTFNGKDVLINMLKGNGRLNNFTGRYRPVIMGHSTDELGAKRYELKNHLGNVLATVNDRVIPNKEVLSVTLLDIVNLTESGNEITKTSGGSGWNAGAASWNYLNGDGYVERTVGGSSLSSNYRVFVGLSYQNTNVHYNTIDYALYTYSDDKLRIFIDGVAPSMTWPGYSLGDKLRVERNAGVINFYQNGALVYSMPEDPIRAGDPLMIDIAMYVPGTKIYDLTLVEYTKMADVVSAQDYYPFGMTMPGRSYQGSEGYRYGFNGMEKDDEVKNIEGSHYTSLYRQYDPRVGRWFSIDPESDQFPWQSPYAGMDNKPVTLNDPDGDCPTCVTGAAVGAVVEFGIQFAFHMAMNDGDMEAALSKIDWADVAIAAGEGAITQGASAGKSLSKAALKYGSKYAVGEIAKASVDVTAEQGVQVVGDEKGIDAAFLDLVFDRAGSKISKSINDGLKETGMQEMGSNVFKTYTKEQRQTVRDVFSVVTNENTQKGVDEFIGIMSEAFKEGVNNSDWLKSVNPEMIDDDLSTTSEVDNTGVNNGSGF